MNGFYSAAQVSGLTTFSVVHIRRMAAKGEFPRPVRLSPKRVAWPRNEVEAWMEQKMEAGRGSVL